MRRFSVSNAVLLIICLMRLILYGGSGQHLDCGRAHQG